MNGGLSSVIRQVLTKPTIECFNVTNSAGQKDWKDVIIRLIQEQDEGATLTVEDAKQIPRYCLWVEAEPLAKISATQVQKFVWKIVYRFGLPKAIITDNGRQFVDKKLVAFYRELGITPITSSVEHPQTNDQAEATDKIIVQELKKRLGEAKGAWVDELPQVL
ncbi:uncharacterized protein LOC106754811 [Vigna radiata var. radiata]|uniref:Uncharacterized protein LOC106754811 n=1 Tax=Vigna radiata var. radiata TaxID=3916 RepID=A0A1S3TF29_VIGRR|nr:uncharacterized protein LOC106754811 [Vigna radiata var. radiata]